MQYYLKEHPQPAHIWHGVSVENQQTASRIDHIRAVLGVKFVLFEPLIAPIYNANLQGIDWAIVGGESGQGARPMHPEWVAEIHRACEKSSTAFFFKQWGAYDQNGKRVGKKYSGREWQGQTWDAMPKLS